MNGGYCDAHRSAVRREQDQRRGHSAARGYGWAWRKYREGYLWAHPLCRECERVGKPVPAVVVDHVQPHKGDIARLWDPANHQPLCKACHDHKTARADGGFGRAAPPPASPPASPTVVRAPGQPQDGARRPGRGGSNP